MPASSEDGKYGDDMQKSSSEQYNVTEILVPEEDDHDVYVFLPFQRFFVVTKHLASAQSHSPSIPTSLRKRTNSLSVLFLLAVL